MPRIRPHPGCRCGGTGADGCPPEHEPILEPMDPALVDAFERDAEIGAPLLRAWLLDGLPLAADELQRALPTPLALGELTTGSLDLIPTITTHTTEEPDA